jgi:hypothetical protein
VIRIGEVEEEKNTHVPRNHIRTAFAVKILAALQKNMRRNTMIERKSKKNSLTQTIIQEVPEPKTEENSPASRGGHLNQPTALGSLMLKLKQIKEESL